MFHYAGFSFVWAQMPGSANEKVYFSLRAEVIDGLILIPVKMTPFSFIPFLMVQFWGISPGSPLLLNLSLPSVPQIWLKPSVAKPVETKADTSDWKWPNFAKVLWCSLLFWFLSFFLSPSTKQLFVDIVMFGFSGNQNYFSLVLFSVKLSKITWLHWTSTIYLEDVLCSGK